MNRLVMVLMVVLAASSLATVGCENKEKQQLLAMQQLYNQVQAENEQLKTSLAEAQKSNDELTAELNSERGEVEKAQAEMTRLQAELATAKTKPEEAPEGWTPTAGGVKTTLSGDILFSSGRATLSSAGATRIKRVAVTIQGKYPGAVVRVYGYTDSDPIVKSRKLWKDNLDLSANRAMAVVRHLRRLGIPAERVETVAMGATHFVSPNTTVAGKARNRRVEIVVVTQ